MSVTAASTIRTAHKADRCATLGPGARAVIWVQGCLRACPGCIAPDLQPPDGGREATIASLAEWLLAIPDIDGLTLSGGEPMEQAAALAELIEQVAGHRDLTTWCYTGYTLEQLVAEGNEDRLRLLALLDVLVDGPYVEDRHTDLLWRGSDNQRILPLTPRGRTLVPDSAERGSPIEVVVEDDGFLVMGIPPRGFREGLERALTTRGIGASPTPPVPE